MRAQGGQHGGAGHDIAIWCAKRFPLDWDRQSQLSFLVFAGQKTHGDAVVLAVQEHIETHFSERLGIEGLALRHAVGRRTLERRFRHATGNSVVEYPQSVRGRPPSSSSNIRARAWPQ